MLQQTTLARKISDGLYGRLEFDFACNLGHAFSEAYLHGVLMQILASNSNAQDEAIRPSHAVPVLQRRGVAGSGRKREVDFAITSRANETIPLVCIEAKWAGSTHASEENILLDLCRLALVRQAHPEATCLFVLAGGKSAMAKRLSTGVLAPHGGRRPKQLLQSAYDGNQNTYFIRSTVGAASVLDASLRAKVAEKLPEMPTRIVTRLHKPSYVDPPNWGVLAWSVFV
ncbi:hypothetical protein ATK74_2758 [Propionicimonas paludicola]|uniref:Uncharacterized protein n=1 Tax=Propionicimonas paludicola TaxID=185243 RepID=A0A2A9CVK3_9ACTN|nr:hypothetical protein [Propionicimonas paludicola]PFG18176.1 hypothetical protein ATK74_2758 [Propionicimonas paludicola]